MDKGISEPGQTSSSGGLKVESEVNPKTHVDDPQPKMSEPMVVSPCPNDGLTYPQTNISHKLVEDEVSRVLVIGQFAKPLVA